MARPRSGNLRHRNGAWRYQTFVGRDPATGRPRYRSGSHRAPNTKAGEKAARAAMAKFLLEVEAGRHLPTERNTLAELIDQWIASRGPDWEDTSATITRRRLVKHVIPRLGSRPLGELRASDIDQLYAQLRSVPLKPATIARIHSSLHAALQQAVRWELIPTNPASLATPPRSGQRTTKVLPEPDRLRAAIDDASEWLGVAIRLAVHTGARRGELARLRWSNINERGDGLVVAIHQTKTDTAKQIPLGPSTSAVLRAWRQKVREQSIAIGRPHLADWVFPSWRSDGLDHVQPNAITHAWGRHRSKHGLDHVRFHDLRHTMATQLLGAGHDVRTVADRGGWSSPSVLLGTYSHAVQPAELAAAQAMDDWLDGTG